AVPESSRGIRLPVSPSAAGVQRAGKRGDAVADCQPRGRPSRSGGARVAVEGRTGGARAASPRRVVRRRTAAGRGGAGLGRTPNVAAGRRTDGGPLRTHS